MNTSTHGQRRSALFLWVVSAIAGWGAAKVWGVGQSSEDNAACLAAAFLAFIALRSGWSGLIAHDQNQILKRLHRASMETSTMHGSSDWATRKQVRAAGMENPRGIFLGENDRKTS